MVVIQNSSYLWGLNTDWKGTKKEPAGCKYYIYILLLLYLDLGSSDTWAQIFVKIHPTVHLKDLYVFVICMVTHQ